MGLPTVDNVGVLWPELRAFAGVSEHRVTLEDAGLILGALDVAHLYQATPAYTVTFASTGVNGVHFGFLPKAGEPLDHSPVIMTVPLADEPNYVVGGSLHDFLSLGCRQGWSFLDQLAHDPEWALSWYEATEPATFPLADPMAQHFDLRPWPNVRARLATLHDAHHGRLVVREAPAPSEDDDEMSDPRATAAGAARR